MMTTKVEGHRHVWPLDGKIYKSFESSFFVIVVLHLNTTWHACLFLFEAVTVYIAIWVYTATWWYCGHSWQACIGVPGASCKNWKGCKIWADIVKMHGWHSNICADCFIIDRWGCFSTASLLWGLNFTEQPHTPLIQLSQQETLCIDNQQSSWSWQMEYFAGEIDNYSFALKLW